MPNRNSANSVPLKVYKNVVDAYVLGIPFEVETTFKGRIASSLIFSSGF